MKYAKVVAAALAETQSKFALAEALALDIPPRHPGPASGDDDETKIPEYLAQAREAVIEAGGEPRSVETLTKYRITALWVSAEFGRNFRWIEGASFSAHLEAHMLGLSYDQFRALPGKRVNDIRAAAGKTDKYPPAGHITSSWTGQQKIEAAQQLLSDPDVQHDPEVRRSSKDIVDAERKETLAGAGFPDGKLPPTGETTPAGGSAFTYISLASSEIAAQAQDFARLVQGLDGPLPPQLQDEVLDDFRVIRAALDWAQTAVTRGKATDWDDELSRLNEGGGS